jgi:hypothetical protein
MRLAQPIESKRRVWLRGVDLNHRPLGYEPNELPDCSTPHKNHNSRVVKGQTSVASRQPITCSHFAAIRREFRTCAAPS